MYRTRDKQLRYGITSGVFAFLAGWGVSALVVSSTGFTQAPRWKSTLWVYLGSHFLELSNTHVGGLGFDQVQPTEIANAPEWIPLIPVVAVAAAAAYTCYEMNSTRVKHNVSNAMSAATGYFLTALLAMVLTDMRPSISMILGIGLLVGAAIWIGSSVLGFFSRGVPFIGVASLGTIAALGIFILMGGVAIFTVVDGLIAIAFGTAVVVGGLFGSSRRLDRIGRRKANRFNRLYGVKSVLEENWKELLAITIVLTLLIVGVSGRFSI